MKLHQKLAVVLASTMAMTAVPVVTMAASTNSLAKETLKVKKEAKFTDYATANALKVKFTDHISGDEIFYLDLDNAKWDEDTLWDASQYAENKFIAYDKDGNVTANKGDVEEYKYIYNGITIAFERQNDDTMKITVSGLPSSGDPVVQIPIFAKADDGDAKISVVSKGGSTTVSKGTFIFATTAEKKISVSAANDKTFYTEGSLSDITIEEAYKGALNVDGGTTFTIELDDSDYYFTGAFEYEYKYGFSGETAKVTATVEDKDDGVLKVTIPKITGDSGGTIILKNIKVKSTNKHPEEGDFLVDIKGDDLVSEKSDLKVATVSEYGVYAKMKDEKAEDVKAGRKEEVEFEIGEAVEDSMITGREFEMTLDNGHWDYKQLVKDYGSKFDDAKVDGKTYDSSKDYSDEDYMRWATKIDSYWLAQQLMDNDSDWKTTSGMPSGTDKHTYCEAEFDTDSDGLAIPETINFTLGEDKDGDLIQDNDDNDVLKFKTKICVPINNKGKEKVTLKVSGRAVDNEASTIVINIINPFNVTYEQAVLKTGLQGQVSGSVTIKETDKDCLQKGDVTFKITKDDEDFNIYLTDATVEVSDGLKGTKTDITKGKASSNAKINLTLNRSSKEAATITFKNMTFTTDRTVPQGTYDLEISGSAIDEDAGWVEDNSTVDNHKIVIKDFIKISTTNTQDITASGLAKGTAKFVIGESKYTLNEQEVTMDAPSYIQDPGYTMVPARYVAQAFGVSEKDILFNKGVVTIFAGERTINLTTGSNIAVVNGNSFPMAAKVVNKNGRTYLPASQIASLLGIQSSWDSATKTATFENK